MACLARLDSGEAAISSIERAFWVAIVFGVYPTYATLGVGQMINHLLSALWLGLLLITRPNARLRYGLIGCVLIVAASVKPNIFLPFGWAAPR
jgi:hypothetical protein